jgi:sugar (pentulose or hexulose) kinase
MVGLGIFDSFEKITQLVVVDREFKPNTENRNIYDKLYSQYKLLYKNNKKIFEKINL